MRRHRPQDHSARALHRERNVELGEEARMTHCRADGSRSQDITVRCPKLRFVSGSQRRMVVQDRQTAFGTKFGVTLNIGGRQRILKTTGDWKLRNFFQQFKHMVVCSGHGKVQMDAKSLRSHFLHGSHLIRDTFERGQMVFHPRVSQCRNFLQSRRHDCGMCGHSPSGNRNPRAIFRADQFVNRHIGRLAHEVIKGRLESEWRLFSRHPVKGTGSDVLLQLCFR